MLLMTVYQLQVLFSIEMDDWVRNYSKHVLNNLFRRLAKLKALG
jgi:hypothetical protein